MSSEVLNLIPLLKTIGILPKKIRQKLLESIDERCVRAICEICLNFCKGNVKCDRKSFRKLKKFKASIYALAHARRSQKSFRKEKKIICQKGGSFLPIILPPVLSALTHYFLQK